MKKKGLSMNRTLSAFALVGVLALATTASAQLRFGSGNAPGPDSGDLTYCFSSGGGLTLFNWCISENGNITHFETPAGQNQVPDTAEGYAVCSSTGVNGEDEIGYVPVPFQAPVVVSGCTGGSLPCVISRDTTDNVFRVAQKFTQNTKEKEIDIDMTVTNLSITSQSAVVLTRLTGIATNNSWGNQIGDTSLRSAWARGSPSGDSLVLRTDTFTMPATTEIVGGYSNGCTNPFVEGTPTAPGTFAAEDDYQIGTLGSLRGKTVRYQLRRQ
jgi:hypothetical protein